MTRASSAALFALLARRRTPPRPSGSRLPRRAGAPAPAAGRALRPPVPQPRRAASTTCVQVGTIGLIKADRPLRHRARRGVLDVRHPDDRRRDQAALPRQGLGDPGAAPAPGAAAVDRPRRPPSSPSSSAAPPPSPSWPRRIGVTDEEIIEGLESANAYSTLSLDAPDSGDDSAAVDDRRDRRRRRGARARREPRVDQAAARGSSTPREKQILTAAVLQQHDPVADRRRDRHLADARLPAAGPHARAAARLARGRVAPRD